MSFLKVNPFLKIEPPISSLIAFFYAKQKSAIELLIDKTLQENSLTLSLSKETFHGNEVMTEKLCKIAEISIDKMPNTLTQIPAIDTLTMKNKKNLEANCVALNEFLAQRKFLRGNLISISDIFLWHSLYCNKKWKALRKKGNFVDLEQWYVKLEKTSEFEEAVEVYLKTTKKRLSGNKRVGDTRDQNGFNKNYSAIDIGIKPEMKGKVVTRFPPEPSGYLHIGHIKAALLNAKVAELWEGRMILRFDDTNPSKEKEEYTQSILSDLETLKIYPAKISYTSDYFGVIFRICELLLEEGKAYADDTDRDKMKEERLKRTASANRGNSIEKNLEMWSKMNNGTLKAIIRLKMDYRSKNGCLRDPTIYRINILPHARTGTIFKTYPTYDFAIPIVDTLEGVTNSFRSSEYNDRTEQYYQIWRIIFSYKDAISTFCSDCNLKQNLDSNGFLMPKMKTFSRLNFKHTLLSKRRLDYFVSSGIVSGWNDPRMPTVRGLLRRGLTVSALRQFIFSQGFSTSHSLMEWDSLWALNKKVLDPIAPRHTAIAKNNAVRLFIDNISKDEEKSVFLIPKRPEMGKKIIRIGPSVFVEMKDAQAMAVGDEITLIEWGNVKIVSANLADGEMRGTFNPDGDFKKTRKVTWLSSSVLESEKNLVSCVIVEKVLPLISKEKIEDGEDFKNFVVKGDGNESYKAFGEANLRFYRKGQIVQLQRKGFAIVEEEMKADESNEMVLIMIPDSRKRAMVN